MSFSANFELMLLDPRSVFPWLTLNEVEYEDAVTGEIYRVPRHFRTDLSSVPIAVSAIPVIGPLLVMRFFGKGIWLGAEEGILHDWLRRPDKITGLPPVPAHVAHKIYRGALYKRGYPPDLCELYYQAVLRFNS